jgi:hypothetical protein
MGDAFKPLALDLTAHVSVFRLRSFNFLEDLGCRNFTAPSSIATGKAPQATYNLEIVTEESYHTAQSLHNNLFLFHVI